MEIGKGKKEKTRRRSWSGFDQRPCGGESAVKSAPAVRDRVSPETSACADGTIAAVRESSLRVFISCRTNEHRAIVPEIAELLRDEGIEACYDELLDDERRRQLDGMVPVSVGVNTRLFGVLRSCHAILVLVPDTPEDPYAFVGRWQHQRRGRAGGRVPVAVATAARPDDGPTAVHDGRATAAVKATCGRGNGCAFSSP